MKNFNLLKENVAYNVLGDRIILFNKAIFSEKGKLKFYSSNKWTGNNTLISHNEEYFRHFLQMKLWKKRWKLSH